MLKRKWCLLVFIFFITSVKVSSSFSQSTSCSLSGGWSDDDPEGGTGAWSLSQDGSNVTGFWNDDGYPDKECGELLVAGSVGPSGFNFKATFENQNQDRCKWWVQMKGAFTSSDCTSIQGDWIPFHSISLVKKVPIDNSMRRGKRGKDYLW